MSLNKCVISLGKGTDGASEGGPWVRELGHSSGHSCSSHWTTTAPVPGILEHGLVCAQEAEVTQTQAHLVEVLRGAVSTACTPPSSPEHNPHSGLPHRDGALVSGLALSLCLRICKELLACSQEVAQAAECPRIPSTQEEGWACYTLKAQFWGGRDRQFPVSQAQLGSIHHFQAQQGTLSLKVRWEATEKNI